MFTKESNRINLAVAASVLSGLLAVLGVWTANGFLWFLLLCVSHLLNVGVIAALPFVADKFNKDAFYTGLLFMVVISLIFGGIVFQWWGIAYAVFAFVAYLVSATIRDA